MSPTFACVQSNKVTPISKVLQEFPDSAPPTPNGTDAVHSHLQGWQLQANLASEKKEVRVFARANNSSMHSQQSLRRSTKEVETLSWILSIGTNSRAQFDIHQGMPKAVYMDIKIFISLLWTQGTHYASGCCQVPACPATAFEKYRSFFGISI